MKKLLGRIARTRFTAVASAFSCLIAVVNSANATQFNEARVTQVVNNVKLLLEQAAPRSAVVSDLVHYGTAVQTGTQSRSELTFSDLTITRLGANTIFSFNRGTREMNLLDGAILFQVPKGSGGVKIKTVGGVTAGITGTTGIGEFHPATTSNPQPFSKWLCLEGTFHLYLPNGQSIELGPGKMVVTDGKSFSKVLTFDIAKLVSTSLFFIGYDKPIASLDLIVLEEQRQLDLKIASGLVDATTTNPLDPTTIFNVINQGIVAEEANQTPPSPPPPATPTPPPPTPTPPPPTPTPSKFGTPSVITSPVPYVITSGTTIATDPAITTNGVTDYGTIYRSLADDGSFSLWAFGSTSAVDTALDFDTHFNNAGHFPGAVFKFTSLVLAGNPTIDLTNGGVTNLALISVGDITSGLPGGTLTFSGLDALLLASQDGSINLGSEITFQDIPTLFFYARGANGDLTLTSPIVGTTDLFLYAGRNITLTEGTDLILDGDFSTRSAGGNISVSESGNISVGGSLAATVDNRNGGVIDSNATLSFTLTGDLTTQGDADFEILNDQNSSSGGSAGGVIDSNATLNISAANISTGNDFTAAILNHRAQGAPGPGAGSIGTNATLNISTGSFAVGGGLDVAIFNRDAGLGSGTGGSIGGNAAIKLNITNTLQVGGAAAFEILNESVVAGSPGGTIGGNANISVTTGAGGDLTANSVNAFINNRNGGSIVSGAELSFDIGGALTTTQGDASFVISSRNDGSGGGTVGSDAHLLVSSASISTGGAFVTSIGTSGGGGIDGDAINTTTVTGDLRANGGIFVNIADGGFTSIDPLVFRGGPHIGGNAILTLSAQNIITLSTASGIPGTDDMAFEASIYTNGQGFIGGNAIINVSASQTISALGSILFWIPNLNFEGFGGGIITGDATINVTAANITANSLLAQIDNSNGGVIDGDATINMNVSGATVTNDATFQILGSDGAASAAINFNGGNYVAGGTFLAFIDGNGTITFNNVIVHTDVLKVGALGTNGVLNIGGGVLSADTTLKLYAPGSNGQLNFISNVFLGGNSMKILAANSVTIFNNVVVTTGNTADVYTNHANYSGFGGNGSTTGTFAGAGANSPQPLASAPTFDDPPVILAVASGTATTNVNSQTLSSTKASGKLVASDLKTTSRMANGATINVSDSGQLLSLLDGAAPGPGGKITIPASKTASNLKNSSRINAADRLNATGRLNAGRRAADIRDAHPLLAGRLP